ncbi:hypothetical protein DL93DRAFT_761033 [Clavulina sp. PMI_390]|nr:hypothetical protein DL93DRAFT_761033 [Clavulina sp. PMI_390]
MLLMPRLCPVYLIHFCMIYALHLVAPHLSFPLISSGFLIIFTLHYTSTLLTCLLIACLSFFYMFIYFHPLSDPYPM